jgi:hypothetical protein
MDRPRAHSLRSIGLSLALLSAAAGHAGAQQSRDVHISVNAMVLASATRVSHAEVNAVSSRATGALEIEVQTLVSAVSSDESELTIIPRIDGVTIEIVGADGQTTPLSPSGVLLARTTGGRELAIPVLLRLRSGSPELLEAAAKAPVSLLVESAAR